MSRLAVLAIVSCSLIVVPVAEAQRSGQSAKISIGTVTKVDDIDLQSQAAPAGALTRAARFRPPIPRPGRAAPR